jgi:hypothetical protein
MFNNFYFHILYIVVLISAFSCQEKASGEMQSGNLDELIIGELTIQKDSLTMNIEIKGVASHQNNEYLISLADRERTIQYYSIRSGEKVKEINLPDDGPNSFKGYIGFLLADGLDSLTIINWDGWFYEYYQGQRIKLERIDPQLGFPYSFYSSMYFGVKTSFAKVSENQFQISISPLLRPAFNFKGITKPFDEIEDWMIIFDSKENKIDVQNINFPYGYKSDFVEDYLSYPPIVEFFGNKNYVLFPYSDSLFILSDFEVVGKKKLASGVDFNFVGGERIVREEYGFFELKKDASAHMDFFYDKYRNIFVRISKIHESGNGETTRERTKHYLLSVYDSDLELLSEYKFNYEPGSKLENYFLASDGFYLNKPNGESITEDEYEFYKIDLSKVKNKN